MLEKDVSPKRWEKDAEFAESIGVKIVDRLRFREYARSEVYFLTLIVMIMAILFVAVVILAYDIHTLLINLKAL